MLLWNNCYRKKWPKKLQLKIYREKKDECLSSSPLIELGDFSGLRGVCSVGLFWKLSCAFFPWPKPTLTFIINFELHLSAAGYPELSKPQIQQNLGLLLAVSSLLVWLKGDEQWAELSLRHSWLVGTAWPYAYIRGKTVEENQSEGVEKWGRAANSEALLMI